LVEGIHRGEPYEIDVDGSRILAYEGETIAAALIAAGHQVFRRTAKFNEPRGGYCGMGVCFDCLVMADGEIVRACMTPVSRDLQVRTLIGHGEPSELR
jgi:aerobic-type carbon monoxide dehydrogenase small subunit (CoxS/CutS family)